MEHKYKVEFLPTSRVRDKMHYPIDGIETAKTLEALLEEYDRRGYDFVETRAITSHQDRMIIIAATNGILVVFKKRS